MLAALPARLVLLAVLVFSQALYAGHSVKHDSGLAECHICLQTSAGGTALPCDTVEFVATAYTSPQAGRYITPGTALNFIPASHPIRAPPRSS